MRSQKRSPTPVRTLADLAPDPKNANRGTARGREAVAHSVRAYGPGRAVLIDRHGRIVAGNKTVAAAKAAGLGLTVIESDGTELVAVQRTDLDLVSDERAKALAVADNRTAELGLEWDEAVLRELEAAGVDLTAFWTEDEFDALVADPPNSQADANAVVAPGPTEIVRGDVFALGRHRVLCGDATVAADVARVLDGVSPHLMVADPPYGVSYAPAWRHDAYPAQRTAVGRVANDDRVDWTAAWSLFPGDVAYVWHAGLHAGAVAAHLMAAGFELRSQIVWVKQHFALSRGHYHWQHEPAWYAVRRGARAHWCGDRTQRTVWDLPNLNPLGGQASAADAVTGHGTQKPVGLFEIPIRNHTQPGDAVFDPFVGAGTAIIAAETTGRSCRALDIDPVYVQVAVSRWEVFTGESAVKIGGGR